MTRPDILCSNTSQKVTDYDITCIVLEVTVSKFRSDGLLTVAKGRIIAILRISLVLLKDVGFPQECHKSSAP